MTVCNIQSINLSFLFLGYTATAMMTVVKNIRYVKFVVDFLVTSPYGSVAAVTLTTPAGTCDSSYLGPGRTVQMRWSVGQGQKKMTTKWFRYRIIIRSHAHGPWHGGVCPVPEVHQTIKRSNVKRHQNAKIKKICPLFLRHLTFDLVPQEITAFF